MFYACFTLIRGFEGRKNFRVESEETNNFFFRPYSLGLKAQLTYGWNAAVLSHLVNLLMLRADKSCLTILMESCR